MNPRLVFAGAVVALVAAQGVRQLARQARDYEDIDEPYAPAPGSAPMLSFGYREAAADLMFFRLVGYFGSKQASPHGVASLAESIAALDPHFRKIYLWGARAMVAVLHGRTPNEIGLRAIRLLEAGERLYPDDYQLPKLAGEIYLFDLHPAKGPTHDAQQREWSEKAARKLEAAIRKPNAPASLGTLVAYLRTKLGEKQQAIDSLRELLLITDDESARKELLEKLAELEQGDQAEIASELQLSRKQFEVAWRRDRPEVSPSLYVLVGAPTRPGYDMTDLATGGHDLLDLTDGR